jgi:membrane-associated phospholipid phosphatase
MTGTGERLFYLKATLILYAVWIAVFELIGNIAKTLPTVDLTLPVDRLIPFVPLFMWPYLLTHAWPFLPFAAVTDWHRVNRAFLAIFLSNMTAYLIYMLVPVAFARPELGTSLAERVLAWYYRVDFYPGACKMPSNHVAFIWITSIACLGQRLGRIGDGIVLIGAAVVTASTVLVKQHIFVDAVLGVVWGFACWVAAGRLYPALAGPFATPPEGLKRLARKIALPMALYLTALVLFAVLVLRRPS